MDESNFFLLPNVAQEISNAQYVDMLNDHERNNFYRDSISQLLENKSDAVILDIGTGTGLLSMMAAQSGAKEVYACEMIQSLARVAQEVVRVNGFKDKISVFCKKSNDLRVGQEMKEKAHICISEIVDSSLIGENILPSLRHASTDLLVEDYKMIPYSAKIYGQVLESEWLWKFHHLSGGCSLSSDVPFEVIFEQIPQSSYELLSDPVELFSFNFFNMSEIETNDSHQIHIPIKKKGKAHAILLWWTMQLDEDGKYVLETTPFNSLWRNHWKQCIYYLPNETATIEGNATIIASRNDYTLWFDFHQNEPTFPFQARSNICTCKYHDLYRRTRILTINDEIRNNKYVESIRNTIAQIRNANENSEYPINACQFGDDIYLSTFLSLSLQDQHLSFEQVETRSFYREISTELINKKNTSNSVKVSQELAGEYHLIIAEPFYFDCQRMYPWKEMAKFWIEQWEQFEGQIQTIPESVTIRAQAVSFTDFQKQYEEVHVEGIDLTIFDRVLSIATPLTMHSLWMYKWKALSEPFDLMSINFQYNSPLQDYQNEENVTFTANGVVHAVIIWLDYQLDENNTISNQPIEGDCFPNWCRQAVWMLKGHEQVEEGKSTLRFEAKYDSIDSEFSFNFDL